MQAGTRSETLDEIVRSRLSPATGNDYGSTPLEKYGRDMLLRMRDALSEMRRQRRSLAALGAAALRATDWDALLREACPLVAQAMDVPFCKVLEYLPEKHALLVRAGIGWHAGVVGHALLGADDASPSGYALRSGQPVICNDLLHETRFRTPALLAEHGVSRAINVIIRGDAKAFGVLEADGRHPGSFSPDSLAFLQAAADLIGLALERSRRAKELEAATEAQGTLMREADHRIKNSLQLIAALLDLQRTRLTDPNASKALQEAIVRVRAVATTHRALHQSADLSTIDLGRMLADLCEHVEALAPHVRITYAAPKRLDLDAERAIPLGLIVSELLTNAVRHAWPEGQAGTLAASADEKEGAIAISIIDDGEGMQGGESAESGLGHTIVEALTRQIGAELDVSSAPGRGTKVTLKMPREAAAPGAR